MQKKIGVGLTICGLLAGCAQPIVTREKIIEYAALNPQQYIEKRFVLEEAAPIFDKMDHAADKLLQSMSFLLAKNLKSRKTIGGRKSLSTDRFFGQLIIPSRIIYNLYVQALNYAGSAS